MAKLETALFVASFLVSLAGILQGSDAVEFVVINRAYFTIGGQRFNREIGNNYAKNALQTSTNFIWQVFAESNAADRKNYQQVFLYIDDFSGIADTTGNEIRLSSQYIQSYNGRNLLTEITGIIYHENTHVWQWDGQGGANPGLIEGIADYVRLRAGYGQATWVKPGEGTKWDDGYDKTARFLDYCNSLRPNFVAQLNKKMRYGYSSNYFVQLLGKRPEQLFREYKAKYGR